MTNEVLNQAIYKVLITQFKKDAKEEHKIVENAGYEIQKYNGYFEVRNKETCKLVRITNVNYGYTFSRVTLICGNNTIRVKPENVCKIDFVNCLSKPFPTETYNAYYYYNCWNVYKDLRYRLREAKRNVEYYDKCIEKAKDNIRKAQNELISIVENKERNKNDLKNIRAEINTMKRK